MTEGKKYARRRAMAPAVATLAALLLAGCSTGHIGESWQCPLAEAGTCDSVAAADPAVPDRQAEGMTVFAEPLWRVRDAGSPIPPETSCAADCDGGFDPFAWLARLMGAEAIDGEAGSAGRSAQAPVATAARPSDPESGEEPAGTGAAGSIEAATAALPAEPGPSRDEPERDGPDADDLRTGEVVARIWIAPFVDAAGVYREAAHVRVVLEPAGWRLP